MTGLRGRGVRWLVAIEGWDYFETRRYTRNDQSSSFLSLHLFFLVCIFLKQIRNIRKLGEMATIRAHIFVLPNLLETHEKRTSEHVDWGECGARVRIHRRRKKNGDGRVAREIDYEEDERRGEGRVIIAGRRKRRGYEKMRCWSVITIMSQNIRWVYDFVNLLMDSEYVWGK